MKLALSNYDLIMNPSDGIVELVVENRGCLLKLLTMIDAQIKGEEGSIILSKSNDVIPLSKNAELIDSFISFDINRKNLVNKLHGRMSENAVDEFNYENTMRIISQLEAYLFDITDNLGGSIQFPHVSVDSIIKASGACFDVNYESIVEELSDYMELVREYDRDKLFILYNLRSIVDDADINLFNETAQRKGYAIILIESVERTKLNGINRFIIDNDLCLITR